LRATLSYPAIAPAQDVYVKAVCLACLPAVSERIREALST
jgi:hypothetical protein